eukprot:TRINITY_DN1961_c0_g2_i13.p2 TRINITY_DN1961_c0_g2~~TRINITY_DN1961_c0_g2_i13.p2  ORF type:complete len:253 (-),score=67.07 TRINITY_DN1961_c0_g2_i13:466-1224(-)
MTAVACKYFIQNDSIEPTAGGSNLFMLSRKYSPGEKVRFKDVMAEFPLHGAEGASYHLRFQTFLPEAPTSPIWVDILNEEASVPLVEPGVVFIKALRLPSGLSQRLKQSRPAAVNSGASDHFYAKAAEKQTVANSDSEEEFDVTSHKEEQKAARPRIDSDTTKTIIDFASEMNLGSSKPDLTPILQPTAYKESVPKPAAPKMSVPTFSAQQQQPQPQLQPQPKQKYQQPAYGTAPKKPDIVATRVAAAVPSL